LNTTPNFNCPGLPGLTARLRSFESNRHFLKIRYDELCRRVIETKRSCENIRREVETGIFEANEAFTIASALMSPSEAGQALMYPRQSMTIQVDIKNILAVDVPEFKCASDGNPDIFPYGFARTAGELDDVVLKLREVFPKMLELAQSEKTLSLLSGEIEKTRARLVVLDKAVIPEIRLKIKLLSERRKNDKQYEKFRRAKVKNGLFLDFTR
jgi:V/A-type H+-transporting ATPase subunit D